MKTAKKFLCIFLTLIMLASSFAVASGAAELTFDVSDAVIVISQTANKTDKYAAERLKYYLDEITGGNIQIVTDNVNADVAISVGATNRTDADFSSGADGSYIITSTENEIIINGAGNKL